MIETRTALARLFVGLALLVIPDGMPDEFMALLGVSGLLKDRREKQRAER